MTKKKTKKRQIMVNNYLVKGHHLYSGTNRNSVINYSHEEISRIAGRDESTYIDSIYLTPTLTIANKHTVEFCFILT